MSKPYWKNICRHFTNGADVVNDKVCRLGICYLSATSQPDLPGSAYRLACHEPIREDGIKIRQEGGAGTCEHFSALTEEEIEKEERESAAAFAKAIKRMELVLPIVSAMKKKYKNKSVRGIRTCPVCQGKLHLSHAGYNGHVHAHCETVGCISFME